MSSEYFHSDVSHALIYAPLGRDAEVTVSLLEAAGVSSVICEDLPQLSQRLGEDTSLAVITEEAIRTTDLRSISEWIAQQPAWSDLPFVVLTQRGGGVERNPNAARLSEVLGNVTFLERPFHPTTFVSMVRSALRARARQYDARALIAQLNEGEQRLRTALQAGHLGSWERDLETQTLNASPVCKAVFGYGADEPFSSADLLARVHPEDLDRRNKTIASAVAGGTGYEIEYRTVLRDGTERWVAVQARMVRGADGSHPRLVGVASDITERKRSEESLRNVNEMLEARVAERTAELEQAHKRVLGEIAQREHTEDMLRQAQKMEMIGQLTGGVAHDFNNLLMAIIGNLDILRRIGADDVRVTRLIDGALQGAQRGASLTQRLLAFARRQDLTIKTVDVRELVSGMSDLIARSLEPRIEWNIVLPEKPVSALIDVNQIELAILNLVVNARDAMPDGGRLTVKIDVVKIERQGEALVQLAPGPYARISITDTGIGMDQDTVSKATEPFFSTKELGKGTGLGLSMVHGLAIQLNGQLRLKSKVGEGTTAEILLPLSSDAAVPAVVVDASPAPAPVDRVKILVVDDDALIAMSTIDMLEDLGHEVIGVESGSRALEVLSKGEPVDLMITDYSMPKMTGAQLARAARDMRPDLPILLATGYAELPANADIDLPRLSKPYRQEQLALEIAKLLAQKSSSSDAPVDSKKHAAMATRHLHQA